MKLGLELMPIRSVQFLTKFEDAVLRQNSAEVSERID